MATRLRSSGGSTIVAIPPAALAALHLRVGSIVDVVVEGNMLVLRPRKRPHYSLAELLTQFDPTLPMTEEEREWVDASAVGNEFI
jgi:antitoxin ChpS